MGYTTVTYILNSHDYGSAGQRVRLFTIGVRNDVHSAVGTVNRPQEATLNDTATQSKRRYYTLVLRPRTHVIRRTSLNLVPATDEGTRGDSKYAGPILRYRAVGLGYQWRVYSDMGAGVTQRATGTNPTGLYEQDGAIVRLTAREAARLQDLDDSVDIGLRWGEDAAQYFVGNAISVFTLRALGLEIKRLLAAWRVSHGPPHRPTHRVASYYHGTGGHRKLRWQLRWNANGVDSCNDAEQSKVEASTSSSTMETNLKLDWKPTMESTT